MDSNTATELMLPYLPGRRKPDALTTKVMMMAVDDFKVFVSQALEEGFLDDFEDHLSFLQACMNTFCKHRSEAINDGSHPSS